MTASAAIHFRGPVSPEAEQRDDQHGATLGGGVGCGMRRA
jgi:hypothetical protein